MEVAKTTPITLYAEQEHAGIRAMILVSIMVSYLFSFWLVLFLSQFLPERVASMGLVLACVFAFPLAIGISWLVEKLLKQKWHSGYSLVLQDTGFHVSEPAAAGLDFDLNGRFSHLAWYFNLAGYKRGGRERRVPDNWVCLCCQVQQDENRVSVYAFASPKQTAVYENNHPLLFEKITPADIYSSHTKSHFAPPSRPNKLPPEIIGGKNGRYWLAEQRRWQEGLELTFADFETFLNYLPTHSE